MTGIITLLDQLRTLDALGRATDAMIFFYYTGTTVLAPIYNDEGLSDPAANPIALAAGEIFPDIFIDPTVQYRRRILYGDGTIHDIDPLPSGTGDAGSTAYRRPENSAVNETVATVLDYRISILSFIPVEYHAGIKNRSGTVNLSPYIQNAIDEIPLGATLYAPVGTYYMTSTVSSSSSVTLVGDPAKENADNSWDNYGGGTVFSYHSTTGNVFTFSSPPTDNSRTNVVLRDFSVQGSRLQAAGTAGHCIAVNSRDSLSGSTAIRLEMENVNCYEAPNRGLSLTGLLYGGRITNSFFFRNGHQGVAASGGPNGTFVGEMEFGRIRCFQNGEDGSTDLEKAGFVWLGGSMFAGMISASESEGAGIILGGGPIVIGHLQCESNRGADQVIIGQNGSSFIGTIINSMIAPGANYTGNYLHLTAYAFSYKQMSCVMADSISGAGKHVLVDSGAGFRDLGFLRTLTTRVIVDNAINYVCVEPVQVVARNVGARSNITGNDVDVTWNPDTKILDTHDAYNVSTGVFTCPSKGLYLISYTIPLTGLTSAMDRGTVFVSATSFGKTRRLGNVGAMRSGANTYSIVQQAIVPMSVGETLSVVFNVGNGAQVVGITGDASSGDLTIVKVN